MGPVQGIFNFTSCMCSSAICPVCGCCPNKRNSTLTRIIYASILFLGTIVACLMLSPGVEQQLRKVPGFCEDSKGFFFAGQQAYLKCEMFLGYKAVYRFCFGMSMWFLSFSIFTVNIKTSRDPRASIHNGPIEDHTMPEKWPGYEVPLKSPWRRQEDSRQMTAAVMQRLTGPIHNQSHLCRKMLILQASMITPRRKEEEESMWLGKHLKYLRPGDEVTADRGFTIGDLLFERRFNLVLPAFTHKRRTVH